MKYIIEKRKGTNTKYSSNSMYIKVVDNYYSHIVVEKEEATLFQKGSLSKFYKKYGRDNLIIHKVKEG